MSEMLPEPIRFEANVVSGAGRGRKMNMPTLNLEVTTLGIEIPEGIYACWSIFNGKKYKGALHAGPRPVFHDSPTIEVHIIDETVDLAPQNVSIELVARLRDVKDFAGTDELLVAIQEDIGQARAILEAQ